MYIEVYVCIYMVVYRFKMALSVVCGASTYTCCLCFFFVVGATTDTLVLYTIKDVMELDTDRGIRSQPSRI